MKADGRGRVGAFTTFHINSWCYIAITSRYPICHRYTSPAYDGTPTSVFVRFAFGIFETD